MNRNEEYRQLLTEVEKDAPELGGSIVKAYKRRRRKRAVRHALAGAAMMCGLFVLLVNVYEPFAQLCAQTPVLKTLAASVTVDYSWPDEVKDEKTDEGKDISVLLNKYIEASVRSVTRKRTNVEITYHINAPGYDDLTAWTYVMGFEESAEFAVNEDGVHTLMLNYSDNDSVPKSVTVLLNVRYDQATQYPGELAKNFVTFYLDVDLHRKDYPNAPVMHADFSDVENDYRIYPMNHPIDMDGQRIMLTHAVMIDNNLTIYTEKADSNTSNIADIIAYTKDADGKLSELDANDTYITLNTNALRSANERQSSFVNERFKDAGVNTVDLVIESIRMLDKDRKMVYVNLATGETGQLPDGVKLHKIYQEDDTWMVEMSAPCRISLDETDAPKSFDIMGMSFYDANGKRYAAYTRSGYFQDYYRGVGHTHVQQLELTDYPYDEVWLEMEFSHVWEPENNIVFTFAL